MKKTPIALALAAVTFLSVACGGTGATTSQSAGTTTAGTSAAGTTAATSVAPAKDMITFKLANNQPDGNSTTIAVEWFAEEVFKRTNGRIKIEVHNNGTLGDAVSNLEQAQYGGMDFIKADLSTMTNFVDDYNALMMPYIYTDTEHFWAAHGGEVGMGILRGEKMQEKNLYGLTYYDAGTRCFYNSKKEIHTPADMNGMLVRVQQSELMMSMVEALGGQSVATAYSEVYSALQTGVVDAAENSIVNYHEQSHYEVAPYFVYDHHTRSADILVMSMAARAKMTEDELKIVDDTALESWEMQKDLWAANEEKSVKFLTEAGVTMTELSSDEFAKFQEACQPIWYAYEGGKYKDLIDQILAAGK